MESTLHVNRSFDYSRSKVFVTWKYDEAFVIRKMSEEVLLVGMEVRREVALLCEAVFKGAAKGVNTDAEVRGNEIARGLPIGADEKSWGCVEGVSEVHFCKTVSLEASGCLE